MKELIGHASNLYVVPQRGTDKLLPMVELILMVSEPTYEADLSGFVQRRSITDVRLSVSPKALRETAAKMIELADEADEIGSLVNKVVEHGA
jgi:hypothetical protein